MKAAKIHVYWSLRWAARFVAKWEGFLSHAYLDSIASPAVWTIGVGHTGGVQSWWVWSKEKAERVLADDLRSASQAVFRNVHVRLTIRQRIALISIAFNCGPGVLEGMTLVKELNAGRYGAAANCFLEWDHAGGVRVEGLTNRRRSERWLMLHSLAPRRPSKRRTAHLPKGQHRSTARREG